MRRINHIDSIRNPIITEKATILSDQNKTVFKVHLKANKKTIKKILKSYSKLMLLKLILLTEKRN